MEDHAVAILQAAESWEWPHVKRVPVSGNQDSQFKAVTPRFLRHLIVHSQRLGGTVMTRFWTQLGSCHSLLRENISILESTPFISEEKSLASTFKGLQREKVDFDPVIRMAAEYFTHLGVAFANPDGSKSWSSTSYSDSEKDTNELLGRLQDPTFGSPTQRTLNLKALAFRRDGNSCPLTATGFAPFDDEGVPPNLAHVIPNSIHGKRGTLNCIAVLAGSAARDLVVQHLNDIGNVMNLETNAHSFYDDLRWGIEAIDDNGEIKYLYRRVPHTAVRGPGYISLKDGDEIAFGKGPDGERLDKGPNPILCNLHLAVARVLRASGAMDVITEWQDEADDSDFPHSFLASEEFCQILDAKLLLSGQAVVFS